MVEKTTHKIIQQLDQFQKPLGSLVFTNGCFDLLHVGHVTYLQQAKALGDRLIVALNDDASVSRLKGKNRPIHTLADRQLVIAALACVDFVISFSEDTPLNLITAINPDILVKGGDYEVSEIVGHDHVTGNGGRVLTLPFVQGHSSSQILKRLDS